MNIRQGNINDVEECYVLEKATFPEDEAASKNSIKIRLEDYSDGFIVGEIDGKIVAHINSGATNKEDITDEEFKALIGHEDDGKNIVIFSLAVSPKYQRQGIARSMMAEFVKLAKNLKKEKILLLCKDNLKAMYSQMGYKEIGISKSTHGGAVWYEMEQVL